MSLGSALSISQSGLAYTQRALAAAADNVANASTAGYTRKTVASLSVTAAGQGIGVRIGLAARDVDAALVVQANKAGGALAAAAVREEILRAVEIAHGQTGQGDSLGDRVAALRTSFIALRADPATPSWQSDVLVAADAVVDRIRTAYAAVTTARQATQDGVVKAVADINADIARIGSVTEQIRQGRSMGISTANLEDQRDAILASLSENLPMRALTTEDGGISLVTEGGQWLSIPAQGEPFGTSASLIGAGSYYGAGGSIPAVTLYGNDITTRVAGGRLGAYIALRDTTLPRDAAELDIAAATLAARFDAQGLTLFTGGDGTVPDPTQPYAGSPLVGFAAAFRTNPAIAADPRLLRDGSQPIGGSPYGAADFTPNPPDGPAGFTTLLDRILDFSFGDEAQAGYAWAPIAITGLGPDGTLASTFLSPGDIAGYAAQVSASQTGERAAASVAREDAATLADGLARRFAERSGVDVDAELSLMVTLQNAYAANARVMSTVQAMWDALMQAVR
ncbi:MAG: flagellar basal body rod C-terminal domain-containing protein [Pseudomonadota bacterium]